MNMINNTMLMIFICDFRIIKYVKFVLIKLDVSEGLEIKSKVSEGFTYMYMLFTVTDWPWYRVD